VSFDLSEAPNGVRLLWTGVRVKFISETEKMVNWQISSAENY
jgi:hypothetical protein